MRARIYRYHLVSEDLIICAKIKVRLLTICEISTTARVPELWLLLEFNLTLSRPLLGMWNDQLPYRCFCHFQRDLCSRRHFGGNRLSKENMLKKSAEVRRDIACIAIVGFKRRWHGERDGTGDEEGTGTHVESVFHQASK
jgi:hypothetical protein